MSYKLITKAILSITGSDGKKHATNVDVRAYASPKRDEAGKITIDGKQVPFKRTGGKGRGTQDNRYMYATVKGESAFFPITAAQADALNGAKAVELEFAKEVAVTPKPAPAAEAPAKPAGKQAQRKDRRTVATA